MYVFIDSDKVDQSVCVDSLWSASGFIVSTASNVSDPLDHIMVTVVQFGFKYFQVANFESRRSKRNLQNLKQNSVKSDRGFFLIKSIVLRGEKHQWLFQHYLKVHRDGGPGPLLLITGVQKLNFSTQLAFLHPTHSFNSELKYFHALHNVNVNFEISYVCIYTEWIMCFQTFMKMQ